jgi:tetratricopeptide (TPR) repeat protein
LQYAIPLNSPYLNRGGTETPSSTLGRRSTSFSLRSLGGGRGVDSWDVSNYYSDLRTKYLNAAQKEIEKKDFKKAAYVYAHLLGDYYNAAAVLERGNFFREAAALHKDHLKNKPAAAQCLEKGGLYSEAIDLYKELKEDEKIGDLYMRISQDDNAQQHYEHCVEIKINNDDMLDAARVVNEKMMQEERAKEILLQGWKGSYQHEPCLKKYFDITIEKENTGIENTVQEIYKKHTPERKALAFLNILEYVNKKANNEMVLNTSQEIAYEILHKEAVKGNTQTLHNLKKFLPGNKLIAADTSRFVSSNSSRLPQDAMPAFIQLDNSINWKKITWFRNQFIAAGIKNHHLHIARVNWYGNTEYYSWDNEVKDYINLNFISNPYFSNEIIIHSSSDVLFARRALPKNKYFNENLVVSCPIWLHKSTPQFLIDKENQIVKLEISGGDMTLHLYTKQGVLRQSINCIFEDRAVSLSAVHSNPALYFNEGFYYSYTGSHFLTISATGQTKATNLFTGIRIFSASEYSTVFFIIISTNKGCTLCKPDKGELNFTGEYFVESLIPLSITFIETHKFVIAEKMKATVFEIIDGKPVIIHQVETSSVLAGVLPGTKRNAFATLEENGKVCIHKFGDE